MDILSCDKIEIEDILRQSFPIYGIKVELHEYFRNDTQSFLYDKNVGTARSYDFGERNNFSLLNKIILLSAKPPCKRFTKTQSGEYHCIEAVCDFNITRSI